jgi:sporulation protein YlmC with PRC-barrel domain
VAKGRFIRPYFRDLKKWIKANAWTPYTTVRRENRGKSEKEVFQEFFKKWVANEKGIALGILKDLFFEVDEAKIGRIIKIVQTINEAAIRSDTTIEIKWTDHPSKRYRIIETIAIAWTGTSHDFNPLEFQTAVLVIGFLINILQYCELRYKTRSKR